MSKEESLDWITKEIYPFLGKLRQKREGLPILSLPEDIPTEVVTELHLKEKDNGIYYSNTLGAFVSFWGTETRLVGYLALV